MGHDRAANIEANENFSYQNDTKYHYQNDATAKGYHDSFTKLRGIDGFRFRFIANRERRSVDRLLKQLEFQSLIDIPTGTGKMAKVFRNYDCRVLACDVSNEMLTIAKRTYQLTGPSDATFQKVDLEKATEQIEDPVDVTVCVRLMHRVPDEVKRRMLEQIGKLSPYAIVSFGIDSRYQRIRAAFRRKTVGGYDIGSQTRPSRNSIERIVSRDFRIVQSTPVAWGISAERMYLLKSKNYGVIQT